jgi:hypothetical protein
MNQILNKVSTANLISDGKVHVITVNNETYIYRYSLKPIVIFSYGILTEDKVWHWYETRSFNSSSQWLNYCRTIIRESLDKRDILTARLSRINLNSKLALLDKINRMKNDERSQKLIG